VKVLPGIMSVLFFMACVDPKVTTEKKENKMNEEKTYVYYDSPIQNYEEYVASKKFVLPICDNNPKYTEKPIYLKDGTRIEYSCGGKMSSSFFENIFHDRKKPFKGVQKSYDKKTKQLIEILSFMGKGTAPGKVGKQIEYDVTGEVINLIDYSKQQGKLGYRYMLEWADKEGYIDLERGKLLKGSRIELSGYHSPFSIEENLRWYVDKFNPTEKQKKAYVKSNNKFWGISFVFKKCTVTYEFADDGTLLYKNYTPALEMLDHAIMNKDAVHDFTGCEEEW